MKKRIDTFKELSTKELAKFMYRNIDNCCSFCVNGKDSYTCSSLECINNIEEWLNEVN